MIEGGCCHLHTGRWPLRHRLSQLGGSRELIYNNGASARHCRSVNPALCLLQAEMEVGGPAAASARRGLADCGLESRWHQQATVSSRLHAYLKTEKKGRRLPIKTFMVQDQYYNYKVIFLYIYILMESCGLTSYTEMQILHHKFSD